MSCVGLDSTGFPENRVSLKPINSTAAAMGGGGDDRKVILEVRGEVECESSRSKRLCSSSKAFNRGMRADGKINGSDEARCPICSRSFHSKKAMYGHMRCHPERGWRGTVIPPAAPSSITVTATAKTAAASSSDTDGLSHASAKTSTDVISQLISDDGSLPPKKRRYHRDHNHQYDHALSSSCSSSSSDILDYYYSKAKQQAVRPKAHECRTSNKTFPTGQVLGGHQTAHRLKKKPVAAQAAPTPSTPRAVLDLDLNQLPPLPMEQQDCLKPHI